MGTKIAILGDIHANIDALDAVIEDSVSQDVSSYICVGDIVGYNAAPNECVDKMKKLSIANVCGNHDHYCAHLESLEDFHPVAASVVEWTRRELTPENAEWLRQLPFTKVVKGFTMVHSTLDMPEKWGYVFDEIEADTNLSYQNTQLCFHGHTHVPTIFRKHGFGVEQLDPQTIKVELGRKYFINTGSVGQPRDGIPDASYCIYSIEDKTITFRRVKYDIHAAQEKIRKAGLPEKLALRLESGH